jgi:hypothetical protein
MKKAFAVLTVAAALLAGCREPAAPFIDGQVTDATIHSITLSTPEGETVTLSTLGTDPMLVPGVLPGDGVRVHYEVLPDGETLRAVQLDLTAPSAYRLIPGIWRDCSTDEEVGLVLAEDGSARATGWSAPLQDWSLDLDEDRLILTGEDPSDAKKTLPRIFRIEKLGVDSLIVVSEGGRRFSFSRQ